MKALFTTIRLLIVITATNLFLNPVFSQAGANDPTFNPTDIGFGNGDGANLSIITTALQSDGKIIIGGEFTTYNGTAINRIARLNDDGTLDGSFNPGTGANQYITTAAIQSDGKIIIGGVFTTYNGTGRNRIARLNADGTLDGSFDPGTGATGDINTIAIQSDGRILIGGSFTSYNGTTIIRIARLNADGSLDAGFDPGTGPSISGYNSGDIRTTSIQSDGKIIIGGGFTTYNGTARKSIARLNTDGTLDVSFDPGTGAIDTDFPLSTNVYTTSIQSDGKILIGGIFTTYNGTARNRIARLNSDGTLDVGFNPGTGANGDGIVVTISLQSDGKIFIGGGFTSYNNSATNKIARLNTDGSLDAGFTSGAGANSQVNAISIQSDGKIIIGGRFGFFDETLRGRIARLNPNGTLDGNFNPGTGANSTVYTTAIQSDGRIIIGGNFIAYNGTARSKITRLNTDGTLDASFNTGSGVTGTILTTAIQTDGKIIIGGNFIIYNGTVINRIARLNTDGTLDAGFDVGSGANDSINTISIQSDGKILIGGDFTAYNGTAINKIARLNTDGTLDAGFNPGTGATGTIFTSAMQSDGKIIIGGDFFSFNGTAINRIACLNTDGTVDAGFNPGTGANGTVLTTAIQSDGKIIIGGSFTGYNNYSRSRLARLNMDGTLDAGFNIGSGIISAIRTTALQSDGKIIIAGDFFRINTTIRPRIARLNIDGTLDVSFNPGIGANNLIYTTAIQSDGNIIIGGAFTAYNSTGKNRVARVIADASVLPITLLGFIAIKNNDQTLLTWETASEFNNAYFIIEKSKDGVNFSILHKVNSKGNSNSVQSYTAMDNLPFISKNYYRLKQVDTDGHFTYSPTRLINFSKAAGQSLNIYPNPANDFITIYMPNGLISKSAVININDLSGKIVKKLIVKNPPSNGILISVAELAASTYLVQVISEGGTITTKMIKE